MRINKGQPASRAGQRFDENLPGEEDTDSDASIHAAGTPGGGTSAGGLAGTNAADGAYDENANLDDALAAGIHDQNGDQVDEHEPEAGASGGAVGGTPAGKRSGRSL